MQTLILLLFGNSGTGKSSFINTLLGEPVSKVGCGGVSQTINVEFYDVGDSKILFPNETNSRLTIIDVPGLQDSHMRIQDQNITNLISYKLFELNKESIDLILLFESASSSSISIRPTLEILLSEFGKSAIQSIVGVVTKWDKLEDKEKNLKRAGLSSFTQIPLVEWINDTEDEKISSEIKSSQLKKLSSAIQGKQPYRLSLIDQLKSECNDRAIELRNEDNNRFEIKKKCFKVQVPGTKVIREKYTEFEIAYKSDAEIRKRAEELRINAGKYSVQKVRQKTEEYNEEYIVKETQARQVPYRCTRRRFFIRTYHTCYHTVYDDVLVTKYRITSRLVPEEYTDYEYYPVENFIEQAMKETKLVTKYREYIIGDIKEETKCEDLRLERHEFSYYYEKAKKEISSNIRNLCKA